MSREMRPIEEQIKIKVIGVGGGGNNAVNTMIKQDIKNVDFYLLNTEQGIIKRANSKNAIQIGKETTKGLGAGADATVGEAAAIESRREIEQILEGTDMLFVTAGMGGGTGTGAAPVVAGIAKEKEILTVGIVTKPFLFEGKIRAKRAELGIKRLEENVNALIVILNDNLVKIAPPGTTLRQAFYLADQTLRQGIQSVTDLITTVGEINIDFADIKTVFNYKGKAYMGIGRAEGPNRLVEAVTQAIENPLTESKIDGAKGVIFNVTGSQNLGLDEINNCMNLINDKVDPGVNFIFGTVVDPKLYDEVIVTVIATGLPSSTKEQ